MSNQGTKDRAYTERLLRTEAIWWKQLFDRQAPYRWNLRRLNLGFVLDVGCGLGRNLLHLNGHGVGVDHNAHSIEVCRERGLTAFESKEFQSSPDAKQGGFDSLLFAHVLEHMRKSEAVDLVKAYLPFLKTGGMVVAICPQERGYASDPTHVEFRDWDQLRTIGGDAGLKVLRTYSFPFPRWVGKFFTHNEFVALFLKE